MKAGIESEIWAHVSGNGDTRPKGQGECGHPHLYSSNAVKHGSWRSMILIRVQGNQGCLGQSCKSGDRYHPAEPGADQDGGRGASVNRDHAL